MNKDVDWLVQEEQRFEEAKAKYEKALAEQEASLPTPFVVMRAYEADIPPTVVKEVFRWLLEFVEASILDLAESSTDSEPADYMDVIGDFEESRIFIGFTPAEEANLYAYYHHDEQNEWEPTWPEVQPGCRPVAQWDSGISTGCTQVLFLRPDGTFFWTEP